MESPTAHAAHAHHGLGPTHIPVVVSGSGAVAAMATTPQGTKLAAPISGQPGVSPTSLGSFPASCEYMEGTDHGEDAEELGIGAEEEVASGGWSEVRGRNARGQQRAAGAATASGEGTPSPAAQQPGCQGPKSDVVQHQLSQLHQQWADALAAVMGSPTAVSPTQPGKAQAPSPRTSAAQGEATSPGTGSWLAVAGGGAVGKQAAIQSPCSRRDPNTAAAAAAAAAAVAARQSPVATIIVSPRVGLPLREGSASGCKPVAAALQAAAAAACGEVLHQQEAAGNPGSQGPGTPTASRAPAPVIACSSCDNSSDHSSPSASSSPATLASSSIGSGGSSSAASTTSSVGAGPASPGSSAFAPAAGAGLVELGEDAHIHATGREGRGGEQLLEAVPLAQDLGCTKGAAAGMGTGISSKADSSASLADSSGAGYESASSTSSPVQHSQPLRERRHRKQQAVAAAAAAAAGMLHPSAILMAPPQHVPLAVVVGATVGELEADEGKPLSPAICITDPSMLGAVAAAGGSLRASVAGTPIASMSRVASVADHGAMASSSGPGANGSGHEEGGSSGGGAAPGTAAAAAAGSAVAVAGVPAGAAAPGDAAAGAEAGGAPAAAAEASASGDAADGEFVWGVPAPVYIRMTADGPQCVAAGVWSGGLAGPHAVVNPLAVGTPVQSRGTGAFLPGTVTGTPSGASTGSAPTTASVSSGGSGSGPHSSSPSLGPTPEHPMQPQRQRDLPSGGSGGHHNHHRGGARQQHQQPQVAQQHQQAPAQYTVPLPVLRMQTVQQVQVQQLPQKRASLGASSSASASSGSHPPSLAPAVLAPLPGLALPPQAPVFSTATAIGAPHPHPQHTGFPVTGPAYAAAPMAAAPVASNNSTPASQRSRGSSHAADGASSSGQAHAGATSCTAPPPSPDSRGPTAPTNTPHAPAPLPSAVPQPQLLLHAGATTQVHAPAGATLVPHPFATAVAPAATAVATAGGLVSQSPVPVLLQPQLSQGAVQPAASLPAQGVGSGSSGGGSQHLPGVMSPQLSVGPQKTVSLMQVARQVNKTAAKVSVQHPGPDSLRALAGHSGSPAPSVSSAAPSRPASAASFTSASGLGGGGGGGPASRSHSGSASGVTSCINSGPNTVTGTPSASAAAGHGGGLHRDGSDSGSASAAAHGGVGGGSEEGQAGSDGAPAGSVGPASGGGSGSAGKPPRPPSVGSSGTGVYMGSGVHVQQQQVLAPIATSRRHSNGSAGHHGELQQHAQPQAITTLHQHQVVYAQHAQPQIVYAGQYAYMQPTTTYTTATTAGGATVLTAAAPTTVLQMAGPAAYPTAAPSAAPGTVYYTHAPGGGLQAIPVATAYPQQQVIATAGPNGSVQYTTVQPTMLATAAPTAYQPQQVQYVMLPTTAVQYSAVQPAPATAAQGGAPGRRPRGTSGSVGQDQ